MCVLEKACGNHARKHAKTSRVQPRSRRCSRFPSAATLHPGFVAVFPPFGRPPTLVALAAVTALGLDKAAKQVPFLRSLFLKEHKQETNAPSQTIQYQVIFVKGREPPRDCAF